jgi:Ca2+-binding RTX toxin-like protein
MRPIAAAFLLAFALSAPASAGTVARQGSTITFTAAPGEQNGVNVFQHADEVVLADGVTATSAGSGCRATPNEVRCPRAGATRVSIDLGDGEDSATVYSDGVPLTIAGGTGKDFLSYSPGPATLSLDGIANDGRPGRQDDIRSDIENIWGTLAGDTILGSDGANRIEPSAGRDSVAARGGDDFIDSRDVNYCEDGGWCFRPDPDRLSCGPGVDIADTDTRDRADADCEVVARDDIVRLSDRADSLVAFRPGLTVYGGRGGDALVGGYEKDRLNGGTGRDTLRAGRGNDVVISKESTGTADRVSCGLGADVVVADPADRVSRNCERRLRRLPRGR